VIFFSLKTSSSSISVLTFSLLNLLPFQAVKCIYFIVTGAPQLYKLAVELWEERKRQKQEEEELANAESSEEDEPKEKKPRRYFAFISPSTKLTRLKFQEKNLFAS
jgi:hypothetical protein